MLVVAGSHRSDKLCLDGPVETLYNVGCGWESQIRQVMLRWTC